MPKIKQLRERAHMSQSETARILKMDRPLLNKIENYVVLPTPDDARKLCYLWRCDLEEMYAPDEVLRLDFKKSKCAQPQTLMCTAQNNKTRVTNYNFCVRLNKADFPLLTKTTLSECGFHCLKDLLATAYAILEKRYKKLNKKEV